MGKLWWVLIALAVAGCGKSPVAPVVSQSSEAKAHQVAPEDWKPLLQRLDVRVAGPYLMVQGLLDDRAPVPFNGGWSLRLLLDTDQAFDTGHAHRYDFVCSGPSRQPDGSLLVQVATDIPGAAWQDTVAAVPFIETGSTFLIRIPLRAIADDGVLDWAFYTVRGRFLSDYWSGSCSPRPLREPFAAGTLIR